MGSNKKVNTFKIKLLTLAVLASLGNQSLFAAPTGASVVSGTASIATSGSTMTITNTPNAIINWANFGIAAGETVKFVQQSSASAVLNRVTGSDPSQILGALQSNGKVFLINPNGIMFGASARIDVNGLVASTLNMTDADFLNGRMRFDADRAIPGSVVNAGQITMPTGGFVYLLAPNVENSGVITTPSGEAILAAGNAVEIVNSTDPSQRVLVSATSQDINLSQLMTQSNGNIFSVLNSGKVSANTVVQDATGKIYFKSAGNIQTTSTSVVEAKGDITGNGGSFIGFADANGNYAGSFDASGKNGGFIETSAHLLNVENIHINAAATDGIAGLWLLDPVNVTIIHSTTAADTNMSTGGPIQPSSDATSIISDFTLNQAINAGTSVTLQTLSTGSSGNGDIIFTNGVVLDKNSGATFGTNLTLSAYRNIEFTGSNSIVNNSAQNFGVILNAGTGGSGGIIGAASSTLTINGASTGLTAVQVPVGKTWTNNGTINLLGKSQIDLDDTGSVSVGTLNNNGTINITNNTSGWAFTSLNTLQRGIINNNGNFNVIGGTSLEALLNNSSSGVVKVQSGTLSVQNAGVLSGSLYIDPSATMVLSETHNGAKTFNGASIYNNGTLTFGVATIFNNSNLYASNNLTIPTTNVTYTGDNHFYAGNDLTLSSNLSSASGHLFLNATNSIIVGGAISNPGPSPLALSMQAGSLIDINSSINIQGGLYASTNGNINVDQSISAGQVSLYAGGTLDVNNPITVAANSYHPNAFLNLFAGTVTIDNTISANAGSMFLGAEVSVGSTTSTHINANVTAQSTTSDAEVEIWSAGSLTQSSSSTITATAPSYTEVFLEGWNSATISGSITATGSADDSIDMLSQNLTLSGATVNADWVSLNYVNDFIDVTAQEFFDFNSTSTVTINNSTINGALGIGFAGNNVTFTNSDLISNSLMHGIAMNDMKLDASSLDAVDEMLLEVGGHLYLDNSSSIYVSSPLTLYFNFPLLASDGWFVDGVANAFSGANGSYISVNGAEPILGSNFFVTYGGLGLVAAVLGGNDSELFESTFIEDPDSTETSTAEDFFGADATEEEQKEEEKPQQCSA